MIRLVPEAGPNQLVVGVSVLIYPTWMIRFVPVPEAGPNQLVVGDLVCLLLELGKLGLADTPFVHFSHSFGQL